MRRLFITVAGLALLALPTVSFAGVAGSPHDITTSTPGGLDARQDAVCFGCHIPHGALGDKLWVVDTTGAAAGMSNIQRLCYTCHDGTVATLYAAFDMADGYVDHIPPLGHDCSGGTSSCHDVHDQPAVGAKFLVEGVGPNGSLCENCHDGSGTGPDKVGPGNHNIGTAANGLVCEDCHGAHTGVAQGDGTDSYILKVDNAPVGGQWGQACIQCHNNVVGPYAGLVTEVWDYSETVVDGTEAKHPTYGGAYSLTGCNECHEVHHDLGEDNGYLLIAPSHNASADFCVLCHTAGGSGAPGVGTGTHFVGDVSTWTGDPSPLPWADGINDDGNVGADWATADPTRMVCETCHSVHKNGEAGYFTRILNTDQSELCLNCHDQN